MNRCICSAFESNPEMGGARYKDRVRSFDSLGKLHREGDRIFNPISRQVLRGTRSTTGRMPALPWRRSRARRARKVSGGPPKTARQRRALPERRAERLARWRNPVEFICALKITRVCLGDEITGLFFVVLTGLQVHFPDEGGSFCSHWRVSSGQARASPLQWRP